MANGKNRVDIQVGFSVDKSGLSEMQSLFQQIANKAADPANKMKTGLQEAAKTASTLDNILSKTFNTDLGSLNVTKFNQELSKSGLTLKDVKSHLSQAGNQGVTAFNRLSQAILGTNQQIRQSNKALDQLFTTFKNTVRYGISSSVFNNMANSIQKAFDYSKQLDTSLNDIRIVTDKSAESMVKFAQQANEASKGMGASTLDYTNAALIYYQQGLSDSEVQARAETTIKAANVTGQRGEEVSEQLTAVWNGYKVSAEETELYVDKLAAVAATTAADLEELSVGMSKVASAANAMGVDFDDLNAQIATIVSVTRQAPESVGTALKTIYARMGDLSVEGGVDEFGVSLGKVSEQMQMMGIQILDQNGNLRDMTTIMAEVAKKWDTWTEAQRQAAAVAMAGKRQYNNLIALFDNWDMYSSALETSQEAMGTLQEQQDIYMESTAAKLKTLKAAWQGLYDDAIDESEINAGIEALTNFVEVLDNFISSFGGGLKSVIGFGTVLSSIFNRQIADNIINANQQLQVFRNNLELAETKSQMMSLDTLNPNGGTSKEVGATANSEKQLAIAKEIYAVRAGLNQEQAKSLIDLQKEVGALTEEKVALETITQRQAEKTLGRKKTLEFMQAELSAAEDINSQYGDRVTKLNDVLANEIRIKNILDGETTSSLNINTAKSEILELSKIMDISEKETFENLINQTTTLEELYEIREQILRIIHESTLGTKEELEKAEKQAVIAEQVYKNKIKIYDIDESIKNKEIEIRQALEQAKMNSNIAQQVMSITSALGNMAMAWSSVNSLIDTWNSKEANFGDKILQTFMTLGMTIPIVYSNFNKLNEVLSTHIVLEGTVVTAKNGIISAEEIHNAVLEAQNARLTANSLATQANTMMDDMNTASEYKNEVAVDSVTEAIEAETVARNLEKIATEKQALADKQAIAMADKNIVSLFKVAHQIKTETITVTENTKAYILNKAARAQWLLIAMAGIATIALIIKSYNNYLKAQIEVNKKIIETNKAKEEEVKTNQKLVESYKELLAQQERGEKVQDSLYKKALEVARAYDIQGASILATKGYYEELTEQIRQKQLQESKENQTRAKETAEKASENLRKETSGGFKPGLLVGNEKVDYSVASETSNMSILTALSGRYYSNETAQEAKEIGLGTGYNWSVDFADPVAVKKFAEQIDYMVEYTKKSGDDAGFSFFQKLQENMAESLPALEEQLDLFYTETVNIAFGTIDLTATKTATELAGKINEVKQQLLESGDFTSEEEVDEYINKYLSGIDSIQENIDKINISKKLAKQFSESDEEIDKNFDDFIKKLDTFNNSELAYLTIHLNDENLDKELTNWVDSHSDVISFFKAFGASNVFKDTLNGYDQKTGFSDEAIDNLYTEGSSTAEFLPSEEEFKASDIGDQYNLVTQAMIESTKAAVERKETVIPMLEDERTQLENNKDKYDEEAEKAKASIGSLVENNSYLKDDYEDIYQLAIKLADGTEELDGADNALIDKLDQLGHVDKETLTNWGEQINKAKENQDAINALSSEIERAGTVTNNYAENAKAYASVLESQSGILDDIQANYKSLTSVVDDYNKTGNFSIDMVQQLISMDDRYVATLQFENGQLVINEDAIKAMTLAKLDDIEATLDAEYQEKMLAIAEKDQSLAAAAAAAASIAAGSDMLTMGQNALTAAQGVQILADTLKQIGDPNSDFSKLAEQTEKSWETKKKALEDARKNISKGGASMRSAMGAPSKSSGGGGGSKDKQKQEKELKQLDEELDRYWEINKALDAIDRTLKKIDKEQEHLNGPELIASLEEENKVLEQQKERYEQLYEAQQAEAAELRGQLSGMGVAFDESSGAILNYAEAVAAALATYNAAVAAFNAGPQDEAAQKSLEAAEKAYENFKKLLDRYDTLYYTEMQDTQEKIEDTWRKEMENKLKAWKTKVELELDKTKLKRQWDEFITQAKKDFRKVWDTKGTKKDSQYQIRTMNSNKEDVTNIIKRQSEVEADMDRMQAGEESQIGFQSIAEARKELEELNDKMIESGNAAKEAYEQGWQNYLDGISQVADQMSLLNTEFERQQDELQFQRELIELLYGDKAYDQMDHYYEAQHKNNINGIKILQQQKETWQKILVSQGVIDEETGLIIKDYKDLDQAQLDMYHNMIDAEKEENSLTLENLKLAKERFKMKVEEAFAPEEEALKKTREEWEEMKEHSKDYYDSVESTYQIQKLSSKYDQSINQAKSIASQEKLNKLKEQELADLRAIKQETGEISEYEVKAANLRYELALREIALEEARNNKTDMKVTRDEQGNWSYQYIADEEDIQQKQQDLLDAWNDLYQLASDALEENLESLLKLKEEHLEASKEIWEDDNLSYEEKVQKQKELDAEYDKENRKLVDENKTFREDVATATLGMLKASYDSDQKALQSMTQNEQDAVLKMAKYNISSYRDIESAVKENYDGIGDKCAQVMEQSRQDWSSSAQEIADDWYNNGGSVKAEMKQTYKDLKQANKEYKTSVKETATAAKRDFGEQGIKGAIDKTTKSTQQLLDKNKDLCDKGSDYINELKDYVDRLREAWEDVCRQIEDAIRLLEEYLQMVGEVERAQQTSAGQMVSAPETSAPGAPTVDSGGGSDRTKSGGGSTTTYTTEYISQAGGQEWWKVTNDKTGKSTTVTVNDRIGRNEGGGSPQQDAIDKAKKEGLATGGYTGEWGDTSGRLAMLHQKELVLNADDTKNFLSGINTIRDMVASNGSIENAVLRAAANMAYSLGNVTPGTVYSGATNNNSENTNVFNITAEFPNANSIDEIREAILSLPNLASQYVHSNLR